MFLADYTRLLLTCPCAPCRAQRRAWELASDEPGERRAEHAAMLSDFDVKLLTMIGSGLTNKEIAARANMAESSVKNKLTWLYQKLGVLDRTQAALRAVALGFVEAR